MAKGKIKKLRDIAVYRQGGKCLYCGCAFTPERPPTAEHIRPVSKGGKTHLRNIAAACEPCNKARSNHKVTPGLIRFIRERPDHKRQYETE